MASHFVFNGSQGVFNRDKRESEIRIGRKQVGVYQVKQYTRTEMRTKAANAMAEMVREKEAELK